MKCILCGTENRANAKFCKGCKANLKGGSQGIIGQRPPDPTQLESPNGAGQTPSQPPASPPKGKRKTELISPEQNDVANAAASQANIYQPPPGQPNTPSPVGGKRKTQYIPPEGETATLPPGATPAPRVVTALPRLVGYLVTYSWDPSGVGFPLREGKNTFGSGNHCDGAIFQDRALSSEHFAILCRGGQLRVKDLDSTNATMVDKVEIWGKAKEAGHGTIIKAGDTIFQVTLIPPMD